MTSRTVNTVWVARVARRFGYTMEQVRAMTIKDVQAMDKVIREEEAERQRMAMARKARGGRRRG